MALPSISLRPHTPTGMKRGDKEDHNNVVDDDNAGIMTIMKTMKSLMIILIIIINSIIFIKIS